MSSLAEIKVELDEKQLREYVNRKMDESINQVLWTIDVNKFVELTGMSRSSLENDILSDPRIKQHERKKEKGKRYWIYGPTMEAYLEILNDW